jgi:hypothetical protein
MPATGNKSELSNGAGILGGDGRPVESLFER